MQPVSAATAEIYDSLGIDPVLRPQILEDARHVLRVVPGFPQLGKEQFAATYGKNLNDTAFRLAHSPYMNGQGRDPALAAVIAGRAIAGGAVEFMHEPQIGSVLGGLDVRAGLEIIGHAVQDIAASATKKEDKEIYMAALPELALFSSLCRAVPNFAPERRIGHMVLPQPSVGITI